MGGKTDFLGVDGQDIGRETVKIPVALVSQYATSKDEAAILLGQVASAFRAVIGYFGKKGYLVKLRSKRKIDGDAKDIPGFRDLLEGHNLFNWLAYEKNHTVKHDPDEDMYKAVSIIEIEANIPLHGEAAGGLKEKILSMFKGDSMNPDGKCFVVRKSTPARNIVSRLLGESKAQRAEREAREQAEFDSQKHNNELVSGLIEGMATIMGKDAKTAAKARAAAEGGKTAPIPAGSTESLLEGVTKWNKARPRA